jgi:hypothetical protein
MFAKEARQQMRLPENAAQEHPYREDRLTGPATSFPRTLAGVIIEEKHKTE